MIYASYVTVNISSPNTQGLRSAYKQVLHFADLLRQLKETQARLADTIWSLCAVSS